MKITLNHSKFSQYLGYAGRAVSQKPNIPILSNLLLSVSKTGIQISATNLDMGINMWIPGKVDSEGKTTISAKFIADFISATIADTIELNLEEDVVKVKTGKSHATFNTISAEEFPVLPKVTKKPIFTISSTDLITSLEKVMFSCSTDFASGKIQQSGVLFELNKENPKFITFVGLDGFRLSLRKSRAAGLDTDIEKGDIIVPARHLQELSRILQDLPEVNNIDVYLSESKSQIIFKFDDIEFSIRLLEGPYPDYKRILPSEYTYRFEVMKEDLMQAIRVINTFARSILGSKTFMDFDIENSKITLKSVVSEVGENQTEIPVSNADGSGDLNAAYNLRYLHDLVNHTEGETLSFETQGPLSASVLKDSADPDFTHLIMPLRREK